MKKVVFLFLVLAFLVGNVNAQQGKMAVGGQVGISLPIGDFGDAANLGFGILGNYFYGLNHNIDLTGSIGYFSWGSDVDEVSYSNVPLLFGGRYYFERKAFTPYALAELGINFFSVDLPEVTFFGQTVGGSASDTEIGINFGGGFLYNLGEMQLDVNGKFNIISNANNISILAGIRYPLK